MSKTVKVIYDSQTLQTTITIDDEPFDTSRINGMDIADWAYPFILRKVRWNGFYDEMVKAMEGQEAFELLFEGEESALHELQEAWEDAPVTIVVVKEDIVSITYNADERTTTISINDTPFDATRIQNREIGDWVYPFSMRKVQWDGIYAEIAKVLEKEKYTIQFTGNEADMAELLAECPKTVKVIMQPVESPAEASETEVEISEITEPVTDAIETPVPEMDIPQMPEPVVPTEPASVRLTNDRVTIGATVMFKKDANIYYYTVSMEHTVRMDHKIQLTNADRSQVWTVERINGNKAYIFSENKHIMAWIFNLQVCVGVSAAQKTKTAAPVATAPAEPAPVRLTNAPVTVGASVMFNGDATTYYDARTNHKIQLTKDIKSKVWRVEQFEVGNAKFVYLVSGQMRIKARAAHLQVSSDAPAVQQNYESPRQTQSVPVSEERYLPAVAVETSVTVTYDKQAVEHQYFHACFVHNNNTLEPYGNAQKNMLYSLFYLLEPACSKHVIEVLQSAVDYLGDQTNGSTYGGVVSCYNELTECFGDLDVDENTEQQRMKNAKQIVSMLCANDNQRIISTLEQIHVDVSGMCEKGVGDEYSEALAVLAPQNDRLAALIRELKQDFKTNQNKIFTYFCEVGNDVVKILHFKVDVTSEKFSNRLDEYEQEKKKNTAKGIVAGALGGFALGFIGAGAAAAYGNSLEKKLDETYDGIYQEYANNYYNDIMFSAVVLAYERIARFATKLLVDDYDYPDDSDNFFDLI